jgi:4-hydroxybenzoate polyprenyltransferase
MNRLGQILQALFWLPILVAGFTGLTFVSPGFQEYRLPSVAVLALFVVLGLIQSFFERAADSSNAEVGAKVPAQKLPDAAVDPQD